MKQTQDIPYGYCQCGCGRKVTIAPWNAPSKGWVKGEPVKTIKGHGGRVHRGPEYLVDPGTGCWVWQHAIQVRGYGVYPQGVLAHRVIYERERGLIPTGQQLDHLCRNRRCVNPDHLEVVSALVNTNRGAGTKHREASVFLMWWSFATTSLSKKDIAEMCGANPKTVWHILHPNGKRSRKWLMTQAQN